MSKRNIDDLLRSDFELTYDEVAKNFCKKAFKTLQSAYREVELENKKLLKQNAQFLKKIVKLESEPERSKKHAGGEK